MFGRVLREPAGCRWEGVSTASKEAARPDTRHRARRVLAALAFLTVGGVLTGAWWVAGQEDRAHVETTAMTQNPPSSPTATTTSTAATRDAALARSYARDLGELATRSGVAVLPLGGGTAMTMGEQSGGVAWSTIKVPIAVAAGRENGWAATRGLATPAITVSDNDAARGLWDSLGGEARAAARVEAALAAAGDGETRVQPTVTRPGFTPFGQTQWPLVAQARAMAGLACEPSASETLKLMRGSCPSSGGGWAGGPTRRSREAGGPWNPATATSCGRWA